MDELIDVILCSNFDQIRQRCSTELIELLNNNIEDKIDFLGDYIDAFITGQRLNYINAFTFEMDTI